MASLCHNELNFVVFTHMLSRKITFLTKVDTPIWLMQHKRETMCRTMEFPWWRHQMENFPRYWPFVRGIHRSPVKSPHNGQWCGALMFSLICAWIHGWVNNRHCIAIFILDLYNWFSRIFITVSTAAALSKTLHKPGLEVHYDTPVESFRF